MKDVIQSGFLGEYELREMVGSGPHCVVWRGARIGESREYALKVLSPRYAEDAIRLSHFEKEATMARTFDHANIVRVHEVVTRNETSLPFIVMELLTGGSLARFRGLGREKYGDLIRVLIQVCDGLTYIHQQGLVHCDIKPSNILMNDQGAPFLTDFGMTASLTDLETTGAHGGTLHYLSPEQFESLSTNAPGRINASSDVYSMGVLMYELFTGQMPFGGSTRYAMMYKRLTSSPIPPSHHITNFPASLESIILKAMDRSQADRYLSASELQNALLGLQL